MATMIDQIPSYHGEAKVWSSLEKYLPSDIVVYNNREINGREFDFCLFIENYGILVIEVKGWISDKIKVLGVDRILVEGYDSPQRSPKKQARGYRFALLNRIVEKYSVSPLVFDMVCYPFISKEQYQESHLDIISEENLTIFKEDLESPDKLMQKILAAYGLANIMPHADFTHALMSQLRQSWEPALVPQVVQTESSIHAYSILSIFPYQISDGTCESIVTEYFSGIKRVIFTGDQSSYHKLVAFFDQAFQDRRIGVSGNTLKMGHTADLPASPSVLRVFNLELYYIPSLSQCCPEEKHIEEGHCTPDETTIIRQLASLSSFNDKQYEVEHSPAEQNTLVEAGAGTGKTFSMVSRVAFLCNKKSDPILNLPEELAMVTFTNDAAINMKVRLKQMFVNYFILTRNPRYLKFIEDVDRAHISTIHSFALDIIRNESLYTGLGTDFRISANEYLRRKTYDKYLSNFLSEMELNNPNFINELPVPVYELRKKLQGIADRLLAKSIDLDTITVADMGDTRDTPIPYFNELIQHVVFPAEHEYFSEVHSVNDLDLKECIILLEQVLDQISGTIPGLKFRYLFIDEFQDTDDVQIRVFQKLQRSIHAACYLFVVGDLKQSIYRFRGARLSAFTQLQSGALFDWAHHSLNINYRTDARLLDQYDTIFHDMGAENYLLYQPEDRLVSHLITDAEENNLLVSIPCHGKEEEKFFSTFIEVLRYQQASVGTLMQRKKLSKEERTIAILVRSNWQVDRLVWAAQREGIKITTKSGGDLFQLPSTQDLYKLLLALTNCSNPVYLINFIESNYTGLSLDYSKYHSMDEETQLKDLTRILDEFFALRMGKTWPQIVNEAYTQPILYVLKQLYDALQPWKQYSYAPAGQKHYMANYSYLLERIIKYSKIDTLTMNQITEYLKINILTGQQVLSRDIEGDDDGIQLICTTIHKSKGLEYGTVILPYTSEDISDIRKVKLDANYTKSKLAYSAVFDNHIRVRNSNYDENTEINDQIAEESRILYVALTRAIRTCVWIHNVDRDPRISWASLMGD